MEAVRPINRKILKLALPNIVSNITIPLLGLVDTALMGHLDNVAYLGAIALGSMIFNVIYWSLGFLRMGTVGFTAQALGADDKKQQTANFQTRNTYFTHSKHYNHLTSPLDYSIRH